MCVCVCTYMCVRVKIHIWTTICNPITLCRVLLDFNKAGSPVIAERVLLQPFHMLLAVERNLCPWYTSVPTVAINLNMGELKVRGVESDNFDVDTINDSLIVISF